MLRYDLASGLTAAAVVATAMLLALTPARDTDLFMHLQLGRRILAEGFPTEEVNIFGADGQPFLYTSWLFAVVCELLFEAFGAPALVITKAVLIAATFVVMLADGARRGNIAVSGFACVIAALAARERFVVRPDVVLGLLLVTTIFLTRLRLMGNRKALLPVPLLCLIWANAHSSIVVALAPLLALVATSLVGRAWSRHRGEDVDDPALTRDALLLLAAGTTAALLNPNHAGQFRYAARILQTRWYVDEITELAPPAWGSAPHWLAGFACVVVTARLLTGILRGDRRGGSAMRLFAHDAFLLVSFIYLGLTGRRFFFLEVLVVTPICARQIVQTVRPWISALASNPAMSTMRAVSVLLIAGSSALAAFVSPKATGLSTEFVPESALQFMDAHAVYGRVFNSFRFGGYVNWRDGAARPVFIDPRGNLPIEALERYSLARDDPATLDQLQQQHGFDIALVTMPNWERQHGGANIDLGLRHPGWALVYWDDVSLLYLRRNSRFASIIDAREYRYLKPANGAYGVRALLRQPTTRAGVLFELQRAYDQTSSRLALGWLGFAYNEIGAFSGAVGLFEQLLGIARDPRDRWVAVSGLAFAYAGLGDSMKALPYFERALELQDDPVTLLAYGRVLESVERQEDALRAFRDAVERDEMFVEALTAFAEALDNRGDRQEAAEARQQLERAVATNRAKEHLDAGIRAHMAGDLVTAERELSASVSVNRSGRALSRLGHVYLDGGNPAAAVRLFEEALTLGEWADAYQGAARAYEQLGNDAQTRHHWRRYLELDPRGHHARSGRRYLSREPD